MHFNISSMYKYLKKYEYNAVFLRFIVKIVDVIENHVIVTKLHHVSGG